MVEDKKEYLEQLEEIERKDKFRKARKTYKAYEGKKEINWIEGKKFLEEEEVDPIKISAIAHDLMREGIEMENIQYSLLGAQLYEKIGRGRKAIPRLLKGAKVIVQRGYKLDDVFKDAYPKIEAFIKRNKEEREQGKGSLEKKFGIFAAFIIGGIALGLGSLSITGNAVSNLTQTTPGLLGIFLFIAGLVGMFFYFKGKYR